MTTRIQTEQIGLYVGKDTELGGKGRWRHLGRVRRERMKMIKTHCTKFSNNNKKNKMFNILS